VPVGKDHKARKRTAFVLCLLTQKGEKKKKGVNKTNWGGQVGLFVEQMRPMGPEKQANQGQRGGKTGNSEDAGILS